MFYFCLSPYTGDPVGMDIYDLDSYTRAVPHEAFGRLRRESPVYFHPEPNGNKGFWAITKYRDVVSVSKDPKTFSSARGGTNLTELPPQELNIVQRLVGKRD